MHQIELSFEPESLRQLHKGGFYLFPEQVKQLSLEVSQVEHRKLHG